MAPASRSSRMKKKPYKRRNRAGLKSARNAMKAAKSSGSKKKTAAARKARQKYKKKLGK